MNESVSTLEGLLAEIQGMGVQMLDYLPRVGLAILILVFGWLLAKLLRILVERAVRHMDRLWQRIISKQELSSLQPRHPPTRIVGELVFWLMLLIFVTLASDVLGLDIFSSWLKEIATFLPLAMAGLLIVLVGFVVSSLARDLVTAAAESAELSHGDLLGRTAQFVILFIAIIIGIGQMGIDIMFLTVVVEIILATMLGGLALAFGLGARTHVSNIIAANQLRQIYQVGDKVRIGDIEGRVMDIMVSRVIIDTEAGTVDMPAKIFDEEVTSIIEKGA